MSEASKDRSRELFHRHKNIFIDLLPGSSLEGCAVRKITNYALLSFGFLCVNERQVCVLLTI